MITIISGTNRPQSNTRIVAGTIEKIHQKAGRETCLLDLTELPPAIFAGASYAEKPAEFTSGFVDPVLNADGLVIVTPEYNGGFPGVLKYFIDMLPFPESFEARPVAFVGLAAGYYGALRPVEQLQQVFAYRNAHLYPRRVFMPSIYKAIGDDGTMTDESLLKRLEEQASGFDAFIQALKTSS